MSDLAKLSIGVIGTGGMGTRHVANLRAYSGDARVAAVYDADPQRAQAAAALSGATVCADPLDLIRSERVEAVLIASPDDTHILYTLECLRLGKPVLSEKPLATRVEDAARVLEAEAALGRRLVSVGFMRRFDPQHLAVRRLVEDGTLGRALAYKGVHRNAMIPYAVSGDVVLTNSAGHDLDAARWLLGQEIEEVYVRGTRSHELFSADTTDLLLIQMGLSDGCLAAIEVFVAAEYGYEVEAQVIGERGVATTAQPVDALLRTRGTRQAAVAQEWLERFQQAYVAEVNAWVRALRSGAPFPGATAWDGYRALVVSDACVRSWRTGAPVAIAPEPRPELYYG